MSSVVAVVDTVVEFYGFVPIVARRESIKAVIARSLCGEFIVGAFAGA